MNLKEIKNCPLCDCQVSSFHSNSFSNLYSEKIAQMVNISEIELLENVFNVECSECGLIFKNKWFEPKDLNQLFTKEVPFHPKGWDAALGRFTANNFFIELDIYQKAIFSNDTSKINQYRRALLSLVDSIIDSNNESEKRRLSSLIESKDIEAIRNSEAIIYELITEPAPYKRFAGFSSKAMWDYFEEKCGGVKNYAELGCPLWGMLRHAKAKSKPASFLKRFEPNYWGSNCINLGSHCTSFANSSWDIPLVDFDPFEKGHLIGFFQYLDHLENPGKFLSEVFNKFEAAAIVLDGVEQPVAIQHYTGWTESSINYIAVKFNKTVHTDFEEIKSSGNYLYLFV
jgi:hypothetical protein